MINRRPNAARSSSDLEAVGSDSGAVDAASPLATPATSPSLGNGDVQGRKRRPRPTSRRRRRWQAYIPYAFVCFYIAFVVAGFTLLGKYLLWSRLHRSANNTNNHKILPQPPPRALLPAYPKIIRDRATLDSIQLSQGALDMCTNALWHTIETTTIVLPQGETFIHTGDIDDLWLRDSAAQIHTLLIPAFGPNRTQSLIQLDRKLDRIVAGLIRRCAMYIRHDPYANAFRIDDSYHFSEAQKKLGRHDLISTWNYELDSGAYYIRLLYFYWQQSTDGSALLVPAVHEAVQIMIDVWKAEQRHEDNEASVPRGPLFDCLNCNKPYRYPGLDRDGKGTPTNSSSGLTWTGFRPSDDECTYHYLVPANMFAVAALEYIVELATHVWRNPGLALQAGRLAMEIQNGIETHAIVEHATHGKIYAYEVDGLGNSLLMDDANVPSLLSIPYLGYRYYDPQIYENTRRFILSQDNPTFQQGANSLTGPIEGYGSPHMVAAIKHNIWPMSVAVKALTLDNGPENEAADIQAKIELVETLVKASAGTGWMHESFDVANPKKFTRSWFCWADSLFAELVLSLTDRCPDASHKYRVMEWRDTNLVPGGEFAED